MLTDEELYEGFTKEEVAAMKAEVEQKYDPRIVAESNRRAARMSKSDWARIKAEGGAITRELAEMKRTGVKISDERVQGLVQRQFDWISHFYTPTKEIFSGLGELYVTDPRFTKNYDMHEPGLAAYFREAIDYYCEHTL